MTSALGGSIIIRMDDIVFLGKKRQFTLDEARAILPAVRRVTERAVKSVEAARERMEGGVTEAAHRATLDEIVQLWAEQIERLGGEAKGLWLVDFDNGGGYFCWRWPERSLGHYHGYEDGFSGRTPIQ